jgi:hypothetical protein
MLSDGVSAPVGDDSPHSPGAATPPRQATTPSPRKRFASWLSVLGLVVLGYVLGAAVMFFQWPSSGFLGKAFLGARAWNERREAAAQPADDRSVSARREAIDKPGKTFDGFTLYSCTVEPTPRSEVLLVNMRGEVVHRWVVSFRKISSDPSRRGGFLGAGLVAVYACHLCPNGDLLAVVHGVEQQTSGYGLVKLDKDSKVLWTYAANVHHDVDVGEDGTIYTIAHRSAEDRPRGLESVPPPWQVDDLLLISPEGKELRKPIPILEALHKSPFAPLLSPLEKPRTSAAQPALTMPHFDDLLRKQDVMHTNTVRVLNRSLAAKFPAFKAGQVLVTIRKLDALVVLDPQTETVVWAARGPWRAQHDAQFLDNGRLLLFDNLGSPAGSRVLEYDPSTQAFPWSYPGDDSPALFTSQRGMCQRLPNGNTLIVNSEGAEVLEVTPGKEVVWSCSLPGFIATARRYSPQQVPFLKGGPRARP